MLDQLGEIGVVGVNSYFGALEEGTEFSECFNSAEEFFFNGGIATLSLGKLSRVKCYWFVMLLDHTSQLPVTGIRVYIKRKVGVWIR